MSSFEKSSFVSINLGKGREEGGGRKHEIKEMKSIDEIRKGVVTVSIG